MSTCASSCNSHRVNAVPHMPRRSGRFAVKIMVMVEDLEQMLAQNLRALDERSLLVEEMVYER